MAVKKVARKKVRRVIEKKEKVEPLIAALLKRYGAEVLWTKDREQQPIEVISTNLLGVNWVLGRGGWPRGRIVEVSGPESAGKTTICYNAISCEQRRGHRSGFLDAETAIDIRYMNDCGVHEDEGKTLILMQPDYGEQGLDMVERLVDSGEIDLIVVDSVAALVPKAELEATMTDQQMGLMARMMAKSMRRLMSKLRGSRTCVIFINQLRDSIGQGYGKFKPQPSSPGGRALKHAASIRLLIKRGKPIKAGSKEIGFMARLKVLKNKVGPPGRTTEVPMIYGKGFHAQLEFMLLAEAARVVTRKGGIYYYKDEDKKQRTIGNGWAIAYQTIRKSRTAMRYTRKMIAERFSSQGGLKAHDDTED